MVKKLFLSFSMLLLCLCGKSQGFNFSSVDSTLNANIGGVFHNKLVCAVLLNDSLIYYYHSGADSTTVGGIASCTKTFSAALMLRLVQEGTLSLDDSIAKYYPFATSLDKGSMTLRNLFAHVSGISGNTNYNGNAGINLQQSADSILVNDALIHTPIGTIFDYTGEDQQVAGAAAELASGVSWDSLFAAKIGAPLGLSNTNFFNTTPSNPRIAGGIRSNTIDMLKLGKFILHNGKNEQGLQVVDSTLMQELWKDQTNHALQVNSPYPYNPPNNNPYGADTIYYGVGTWLDIYNPTHQYQEQISADGAYGGIIWINRCTNMVGVFLTFLPSTVVTTAPVEAYAMDILRNSVPFNCYNTTTGLNDIAGEDLSLLVYPNPVHQKFIAELPQNNFDLSVTNVTGQKMCEIKNISNKAEIDLKGLVPGVYFVKATGQQGIFIRKIILE